MEELQLSETQLRYFSDLFLLCSESENSNRVPGIKAYELFRTSKLSNEVLRQIADLCSLGASSDFGRREFYAALKLIAAAQAGLTVSTEMMASVLQTPLPRFTWTNDDQSDLIQLSDSAAATVHKNSPSASSTASDSPTPTNSVQDKGWAAEGSWQGIVCEEQRQLLGTEEESSDRHSSDEEADTQRGSNEEGDELWVMTDEQREYYTAQFRSLQPASSGLLAGPIARLFFEKSRLPVQELRKIWQLADITKDGALSIEEFNIAMHLVVLRRNQIPLPNVLPASLLPAPLPPPAPAPAPPPREDPPSPGQSSITSESRGSKQWTKFVDSPTSSISSPGPKPVNFDFHKSAVEQDPKIFHPVPVRVTPEMNHNAAEIELRRNETDTGSKDSNQVHPGKKALLQSLSTDNADIRPIQRPQPRKPPPGPGAIPPPPTHNLSDDLSGPTSLPVNVAPKKDPPPPPPPRPYRTHARSSSLDLNRLGRSASLQAPPALPPRVSPNSTSPKRLVNQRSEGDVIVLSLGVDDENVAETDGAPRKHGAFHVYRKIANQCAASDDSSVKRLELQNSALSRLCLELNQELVHLLEERNLLQAKLDYLQSCCTW